MKIQADCVICASFAHHREKQSTPNTGPTPSKVPEMVVCSCCTVNTRVFAVISAGLSLSLLLLQVSPGFKNATAQENFAVRSFNDRASFECELLVPKSPFPFPFREHIVLIPFSHHKCFSFHFNAVMGKLSAMMIGLMLLSCWGVRPQPPVLSQKFCCTNGRCTAVQMEGVLLGFPFFKT